MNSSDNCSSWILKYGNVEDEATSKAYEIFQFTTTCGTKGTIQIDRGRSRDARHVFRELLSANAVVPACEIDAIADIERAIETPAPDLLLYAEQIGWRPRYSGFVLSDGCISSSSSRVRRQILPPQWMFASQLQIHRQSGSLEQWRHQVPGAACCSSLSNRVQSRPPFASNSDPSDVSGWSLST
jgi:hypothetical protein